MGTRRKEKGAYAEPYDAGVVAGHLRPRLATTLLVLLAAATGARVVAVRLDLGLDRFDGRGQRIVIFARLLALVVLALLFALMETVGLRIKAAYHWLADLLESCEFLPRRVRTRHLCSSPPR